MNFLLFQKNILVIKKGTKTRSITLSTYFLCPTVRRKTIQNFSLLRSALPRHSQVFPAQIKLSQPLFIFLYLFYIPLTFKSSLNFFASQNPSFCVLYNKGLFPLPQAVRVATRSNKLIRCPSVRAAERQKAGAIAPAFCVTNTST